MATDKWPAMEEGLLAYNSEDLNLIDSLAKFGTGFLAGASKEHSPPNTLILALCNKTNEPLSHTVATLLQDDKIVHLYCSKHLRS